MGGALHDRLATAMTDRRAEAFDVLDNYGNPALGPVGAPPGALAALRSVLNIHHPYILRTSDGPTQRWCEGCGKEPCPTETAVIDALLGPEQ